MLCERCKIREANIQYTEVINGIKKEHNLCAHCAKELDFGPYSAIFDSEFPLGKLLSGLLGIDEEEKEDKMQRVVCPTCQTTYEEFINNSQFGCPDCYGVFDLLISENIKQLQGSDSHTGKKPKYHNGTDEVSLESAKYQGGQRGENRETELTVLKARLQDAVSREEYGLAAECRDKIKALREGRSS